MGTLSIVATPIGNLEDITLRALRTLKEADLLLCEDTRVTSKLLAKYEIQKPLMRCDAHVDNFLAPKIIEMLEEGKNLALVTDAGTPGISDPGSRLVMKVREAGFAIVAIPGPSALTAALSIAGLEAGEFVFMGFLPHKKGRATAIKRILQSDFPSILYESPHRILKLLMSLGETKVTVARELTKLHEEIVSGTAAEVAESLTERGAVRGEFVVIVEAISTARTKPENHSHIPD